MIAVPDQSTSGDRAERGWSLFREGAVKARAEQPTRFRVASQSGGGQYRVDTLRRTCTCPDHRYRGTFCKHLWAALLALPQVAAPSARR